MLYRINTGSFFSPSRNLSFDLHPPSIHQTIKLLYRDYGIIDKATTTFLSILFFFFFETMVMSYDTTTSTSSFVGDMDCCTVLGLTRHLSSPPSFGDSSPYHLVSWYNQPTEYDDIDDDDDDDAKYYHDGCFEDPHYVKKDSTTSAVLLPTRPFVEEPPSLRSSTSSTSSTLSSSSLMSCSPSPSPVSSPVNRKRSVNSPPSPPPALELATAYISTAYDLVWKDEEYDRAFDLLKEALDIQQEYLGKHHKEVGNTCDFIGTALLCQNEDLGNALRYYLEARRIYCKSQNNKGLKNVNERIQYVMSKLGLNDDQISQYQGTIERIIDHEQQGDRLKTRGQSDQAKVEYQTARRLSSSLKPLLTVGTAPSLA